MIIMPFRYAFLSRRWVVRGIKTQSDSGDGGSCIGSVRRGPFSTHFITIRRRVGRVRLVKIQRALSGGPIRVTAVKK